MALVLNILDENDRLLRYTSQTEEIYKDIIETVIGVYDKEINSAIDESTYQDGFKDLDQDELWKPIRAALSRVSEQLLEIVNFKADDVKLKVSIVGPSEET